MQRHRRRAGLAPPTASTRAQLENRAFWVGLGCCMLGGWLVPREVGSSARRVRSRPPPLTPADGHHRCLKSPFTGGSFYSPFQNERGQEPIWFFFGRHIEDKKSRRIYGQSAGQPWGEEGARWTADQTHLHEVRSTPQLPSSIQRVSPFSSTPRPSHTYTPLP